MASRGIGIVLRYLYPKTRKKGIGVLMFGLCVILVMEIFHYNTNFNIFNKSQNDKHSEIIHMHDGLEKTGYLQQENGKSILSKTDKISSAHSFEMNPLTSSGNPPEDPVPPKSVLIFTDFEKSNLRTFIKHILSSWKINYDFVTWNKPYDNFLVFPRLQDQYGLARYQTFIFTSHLVYNSIDAWSLQIIKHHCTTFNVGIIILMDVSYFQGVDAEEYRIANLPVTIKRGQINLKDFEIAHSKMNKITKSGKRLKGVIEGVNHALFYTDDASFEPVAYCKRIDSSFIDQIWQNDLNKKEISILFDTGKNDGILKVLFGSPISTSFLHQLLFLDALRTLSSGNLGFDTERYIQIDIDDIFVGKTGKKLKAEDVEALAGAQDYFSKKIPGFYFNLGYSSKFYQNSEDPLEREGDALLVKYSDKFRWFGHSYAHSKPHTFNKTQLVAEFELNKKFAKQHNIEVDNTYSVSPHHSGIYPTHDALYEAWKEVWGVKVTSTEGYPHLNPAWGRKGFSYKDIFVLPRQTCGLFTKTLHIASYPKGADFLYKSSHGGELFWSIVYNPVTIFMTHAGNYGFQERLAIPLFKNVTTFIKRWTNIKLIGSSPVNLANKYFSLFPKQLDPLWMDPCSDVRHRKIWNGTEKYCKESTGLSSKTKVTNTRLPNFLILGPQKTGTTALYSFLAMHPNLYKSRVSKQAFEEIQFFSRNNYFKGLNWYMSFFPDITKKDDILYFDKSANYFDSLKSPLRAHAIVPNAKLVIITIDPRKRAYSWYQHVLSKKDGIAENHTFYEVITERNKTSDPRFTTLRRRCLIPGLYAIALERWLQYYQPENIFMLDGSDLIYKPHLIMDRLSHFLNLPPFPFHKRIRYNSEKGFFCSTASDASYQCLGKGKGRKYPKMGDNVHHYLTDFYRVPNLRLAELLRSIHMPLPNWLKKEVDNTS